MPEVDEPSFERVANFAALCAAAKRASKGHRRSSEVARFLMDVEPEVLALESELRGGHYRPRPYRTFEIREPKPRTISAAAFRDRVVHHALCAELEGALERGGGSCPTGRQQSRGLGSARRNASVSARLGCPTLGGDLNTARRARGSNRVKRGGSWNNDAQNARAANRNNDDPSNRNNNLGFRLSSPGALRLLHARPDRRDHGFAGSVSSLTTISEPVPRRCGTAGPKMNLDPWKCGPMVAPRGALSMASDARRAGGTPACRPRGCLEYGLPCGSPRSAQNSTFLANNAEVMHNRPIA